MRLALVSDGWRPQVNGVARRLAALYDGLLAAGHDAFPLTPELFRTVPVPDGSGGRLAIAARPRLTRLLERLMPDAIHIATEGPLGTAARRYCRKRKLHFTTAYHTKYPEYLNYASADVFVLPSRTETFGLVMLEALACGAPVAALPVPGPLDVIGDSSDGSLEWVLRAAAIAALEIPRELRRCHAERFSWQTSIKQFLSQVVPVGNPSGNHFHAERAYYAGLV